MRPRIEPSHLSSSPNNYLKGRLTIKPYCKSPYQSLKIRILNVRRFVCFQMITSNNFLELLKWIIDINVTFISGLSTLSLADFPEFPSYWRNIELIESIWNRWGAILLRVNLFFTCLLIWWSYIVLCSLYLYLVVFRRSNKWNKMTIDTTCFCWSKQYKSCAPNSYLWMINWNVYKYV